MATQTTMVAQGFKTKGSKQSSLGSALDGVITLWYRDIIRFARDRSRIVGSLAQPVLFLIVFGIGLSPAIGSLGSSGGLDYRQFIFPGIVAMSVLFTSMFSAVSVIWDREFGFLKEVLVAPVPRWSLVAGKALGLLNAGRMKSMEGFQMIMNFLMMLMFFLSGAFFSLSNLPG